MNRRTLAFVGAAVLAVVGAGLLFLSARGSDDDGAAQAAAVDASAVAEPAVAVDDTETADGDVAVDAEATGADDFTNEGDDVDGAEAEPTERDGTGLAQIIDVPEEFVEITSVFGIERALGGQLRPGDLVGVLISYENAAVTDLVLHKVLVSNVQAEAPTELDEGSEEILAAAPPGRFYVTFALSAADAEKLAHGFEFGRIWLTYEPETADETSPGVQTSESVLEALPLLPELATADGSDTPPPSDDESSDESDG